jgi:hypothetical protein
METDLGLIGAHSACEGRKQTELGDFYEEKTVPKSRLTLAGTPRSSLNFWARTIHWCGSHRLFLCNASIFAACWNRHGDSFR